MKRILLPLLAAVLALPATTDAQGGDQDYCTELSALYRRYVKNSPGHLYDAEAALAQEECQKGNAAEAIPILEKKLQESKVRLPKKL